MSMNLVYIFLDNYIVKYNKYTLNQKEMFKCVFIFYVLFFGRFMA